MSRLDEKFPILFQNLFPLYGEIYDSIYFIEELLYVMADSWIDRSDELKTLDKNRIVNPVITSYSIHYTKLYEESV